MKKHAGSRCATIHLENNHPGCMWGILHILKYNHWHRVKKRLPYRRHGRGRHSAGKSGNTNHAQNPDRPQEHNNAERENSTVPGKKKSPICMNKYSVKARLKALIAEERSWTKGQHHRSSTSTAHGHSVSAASSHQSKSNGEEGRYQTQPCDGTNRRILHTKSGSFSALPDDPSENRRVEDHPESSNQQKLPQRVFYPAKALSDTPGLVGINEELLQKILHDKRRFLPQRFHSQKHFSTRSGLQRSGTFNAHDPSGASRASKLQSTKTKEGTGAERDGISNITFTPVPLPRLEDQRENPAALKRFRDVKEKMQHVIRTNRNEEQRIVMDGVLDKIPNDQRLSEEKKEELIKKWRDRVINKDYQNSPRSEEKYEHRRRDFKRTSSLDRSMDKYSQLFETSFNREAKTPKSESLQVKDPEEAGLRVEGEKRSLGRILSLPELKSYSLPSTEDSSSNAMTLEAPKRGDLNGTPMLESSSSSPKDKLQLDEYLEVDQTREKKAGVAESAAVQNSKELAQVGPPSTGSKLQAGIDPTVNPDGVLEPSAVLTLDNNSQEITPSSELQDLKRLEDDSQDSSPIEDQGHASADNPLGPDIETDLDYNEFQEDGTLEHFQRIQVDAKDMELFNYVRDVLELSGLCGPEALEAWHSDDQPVDPLVYEEVEGCPLMDPECPGNKENGECNHLLLFDLINEVLIDIYQQSVSYWPLPLSRHCHIHRMPLGPPLLKEVWTNISTCLGFRPALDPTQDYTVSRDLEKCGRWMNLQFESECVGIELEEFIFDDLLEELFD